LQEAASCGDVQDVAFTTLQKTAKYTLLLVPLSPPKVQYDMTKIIVFASYPVGIAMTVANDALIKAVESLPNQLGLDLIELIISAGADVNCSNGKCSQVAAKSGNLEIFGY
jgi:hypothetical protein